MRIPVGRRSFSPGEELRGASWQEAKWRREMAVLLYVIVAVVVWFVLDMVAQGLVWLLEGELYAQVPVAITSAVAVAFGTSMFAFTNNSIREKRMQIMRAHAFIEYAGYAAVMAVLKQKALECVKAFDDEEHVRKRIVTVDVPNPADEDYNRAQERSSRLRQRFTILRDAAHDVNIPVPTTIYECATWDGEPPVPKVERSAAQARVGATVDMKV